jgi:hypothetical protein
MLFNFWVLKLAICQHKKILLQKAGKQIYCDQDPDPDKIERILKIRLMF